MRPTPNVRKFQKKMRQLARDGYRVDKPVYEPRLSDASVSRKVNKERRIRGQLARLEHFGKQNRGDLTSAEGRMQAILVELGWRFNCEHPKGKYILDFYVHQHR